MRNWVRSLFKFLYFSIDNGWHFNAAPSNIMTKVQKFCWTLFRFLELQCSEDPVSSSTSCSSSNCPGARHHPLQHPGQVQWARKSHLYQWYDNHPLQHPGQQSYVSSIPFTESFSAMGKEITINDMIMICIIRLIALGRHVASPQSINISTFLAP